MDPTGYSQTDIQYALETTRVLYEPNRRIDSFGSTRFTFQLLSELMDSVGKVRIRSGEVEAIKPQILKPEGYQSVEFEGFSPDAQRFLDWSREQGVNLTFLRYGFHFRRSDISEELVHEPMHLVRGRLLEDARREGNPINAIIEGVDDTWEISILRFTFEMITKSSEINLFDFKRKGLL